MQWLYTCTMILCKTTLTENDSSSKILQCHPKKPLDAIGAVQVPLQWSTEWFAEDEGVKKMLINVVHV